MSRLNQITDAEISDKYLADTDAIASELGATQSEKDRSAELTLEFIAVLRLVALMSDRRYVVMLKMIAGNLALLSQIEP